MSCNGYPTADNMKLLETNAETINEVVTSTEDLTNPASDGLQKTTLVGIDNLASTQRDQFDATFTAQFTFKRVGNISDYAGQQLSEADKLNAYQYPDNSGEWYGPIQSQTFPITIPSDPASSSAWALVSAATQSWVADNFSNANLLSNHNFLIPSPDDVTPPSATPTTYPAGTQIFSGVFANDSAGITDLTYANGRVSFSSGDFYMAVANTGALENITEFVASVADFDGKPRTRGVSYALVGGEYRVTVGVDALEGVGGNDTPLGSVKFEQGSVATGHEVGSISVGNLSDYTDIVYKASGENSAVDNMVAAFAANPLARSIGTICKTGGTTWEYVDSTGPVTAENFRAFDVANVIDFGSIPDYDRVNNTGTDNHDSLQACFDYCEAKKKIPLAIGDFGFNGQLTLSQYGIMGSDKQADSIYQMDETETATAFIYNTVGGWTAGRGKIKDITLGVQNTVNNGVIEVSTPSDGFAFESAQLRIGTSFGVGLRDSYYINFDNTVFQGRFIDNNDPTIGELLRGQGIKVLDGNEVNNLKFNKCYFQSLSIGVAGSGDNFEGSNTLEFSSCNFERIGDLPLQVRGWHANFTSCYFEKLDQNKSLNTEITGGDLLTKIVAGGIGDLTFRNCLLNAQDVDTLANNPDVRMFSGQEQVFAFKNCNLQKPENYQGEILNYPTFGDAPVMVLESSLGFVDQANGIWEHKSQDKTNVRSESLGKGQIAASPMYADATYAQASYRYVTIPSSVNFTVNNPQPFGIIDGRNYDETIQINVEAKQTRVNNSNGDVEQMDVSFSAIITPDLPLYATIVNSSLTTTGSTMFESAGTLIAKIKCWRLTPDRVTTPSPTDQDPFAYQLAIDGEAAPGSTPKILTTISKLEVVVVKNWHGNDLKLGVYQQSSNFAASAP